MTASQAASLAFHDHVLSASILYNIVRRQDAEGCVTVPTSAQCTDRRIRVHVLDTGPSLLFYLLTFFLPFTSQSTRTVQAMEDGISGRETAVSLSHPPPPKDLKPPPSAEALCPGPGPGVPKIDHIYNDSEADLDLISSDGVIFLVMRYHLQSAR